MAHAGSAHGITVDDMEIKGLLEDDEVKLSSKMKSPTNPCLFQDLMSGSEYWNLHLIVTNRKSVSRQNNSVAGIRCCNNFLLLRLLQTKLRPELNLKASGRARHCLAGSNDEKVPSFFISTLKKINDKSLQVVFVCLMNFVLSRFLSFLVQNYFKFQVLKDGSTCSTTLLSFDGLSYASLAKQVASNGRGKNKLATLGDAMAISKSETINDPLTHTWEMLSHLKTIVWNSMDALSNPIPLVKRSSEQFLLKLIWKVTLFCYILTALFRDTPYLSHMAPIAEPYIALLSATQFSGWELHQLAAVILILWQNLVADEVFRFCRVNLSKLLASIQSSFGRKLANWKRKAQKARLEIIF